MSATENEQVDLTNTENIKDTTLGTDTASKTKNIIAAAKERNRIEQRRQAITATNNELGAGMTDEERERLAEAGKTVASANVQTRAHTLTGVIDPAAMGDVKGDGGDAVNYADGDPAKRLGVPTFIHGLGETNTSSPSEEVLIEGPRIDARTNAEIEAGRKALAGRSRSSAAELTGGRTRTVVSDEPVDPDADGAGADAGSGRKARGSK